MSPARPIIVIKRQGVHAAHHGGAWKVAYADFVTAMMALFIVLWLMNTSKQVQEAVSGYFKDPRGSSKKIGSNMMGAGENFIVTRDNMNQIKQELQKSIRKVTVFEKLKDHIEMTVTAEGLRIELLESEIGTFFPSGVPQPNQSGKEILASLARELGKLPNHISIEGHTDARPFAGAGEYGNWELSADRANAARRLMMQSGLAEHQVSQVRGYAAERLRNARQPEDPSNRRISLIVQYQVPPDEEEKAAKPASAPARAPAQHH